ncbi:gamma-aminobutyric acid type B receptor subunit 2-like [Physella acuta]|uniref:gamma-aminobutyric acid type B receptor subunit 2-like n=1 Tax=Physella acuta TaxID=109671 RepID=UPI0027DCE01F|nr:gamma-aminobutyric acid type B receptor subunit 2-like [Physella acuta]
MAANVVLILAVMSLTLNLKVLNLGRTVMASVADSAILTEAGKLSVDTGKLPSMTGKPLITSETGKTTLDTEKPLLRDNYVINALGKKHFPQKPQRIARSAHPDPTSSSTHPLGQGRDGVWSPTTAADSDPTRYSTHPLGRGRDKVLLPTVTADFKENKMAAAGGDENAGDTSVLVPEDSRITLNIIGMFALTGIYPAGYAYLPAAMLAVKHINENFTDILPSYKLKINAYDSGCNESAGLNAFYEEIYNPNRTSIMTLGDTCSPVTEATAQVSHLWGLKQISYSAVSPHLSNKEIFPSFFRVMTPEQNLTVARVKLFKEMGWKKVHTIYQNLKLFSTLDEYMKQDLRKEGIEVASTEMFTNDPTNSVQNLKESDARIIIANMYEDKARHVVCAVYNMEAGNHAWYKRVVWVFQSFYDRHWMDVRDPAINCTVDQIKQVIGSYFTVGSKALNKDPNYKADNGLVPVHFDTLRNSTKLYEAVKADMPPHFQEFYAKNMFPDGSFYGQHRAPEAYDAVWAIAIALKNALEYLKKSGDGRGLEDFRYKDKFFSSLLQDAMYNVSFNSLSGPFFFNENGERTPGIEIIRYNNNNDHTFNYLGACHLQQKTVWNCTLDKANITWQTGQPPVDGIQTKARTYQTNTYLKSTFWTLASLGNVLTLGLLAFNIVKRNHRVIKMSSPRLNNVILVGCILAYSTIYSLDAEDEGIQSACVISSFTIVLSFSLSFGALFAKTWRVYEIFTAGHKVLNTRMLRDSSLFLIVGVLVFINSTILVGWMIAYPQRPTLVNISMTPSSEVSDVQYFNQFQRCDSEYRLYFMWALIAIQGVVILFGTFLAIQTRKVSCPELNDSKWIALCIYNVVVLSPVGLVVVMATEDKPEVNYALESCILILITTMTECLVFVPKILSYRSHNSSRTTLDIKFKVRRPNNVFKLCVVEKRGSDSSTCCEASQQTDDLDLSWDRDLYHCDFKQDPGSGSTASTGSQNPGSPCRSPGSSLAPCVKKLWTKRSYCDKKTDTHFEPSGKTIDERVCTSSCLRDENKNKLYRSMSDSDIRHHSNVTLGKMGDDDLVTESCEHCRIRVKRHNKIWRHHRKDDASVHPPGHRKHGVVVDRVKVTADVKMWSKFRTRWREDDMARAEQIGEQILHQLRETVKTVSANEASA